MKLFELRKKIKSQFKLAGIEESDADFIIAECLRTNRTELSLIDEIDNAQTKQILKYAKLRLNHMPVDKIFKRAYFYGNQYKVNKFVLTPRADSEVLVEYAIKLIKKQGLNSVLDLCTGSGCLAISIAKHTNALVCASDISNKALKIAKHNARQNGVEIKFVHSNMFEKIRGKFDLIISNPPYIETDVINLLDAEVKKFDPQIALDGGADGLKYYREINDVSPNCLNSHGYVILEIGYNQQEAVKKIFTNFTSIECLKDLQNNDRVMVFKSKN